LQLLGLLVHLFADERSGSGSYGGSYGGTNPGTFAATDQRSYAGSDGSAASTAYQSSFTGVGH
jgi:hypothetical protein